jgi:aspartate racemase
VDQVHALDGRSLIVPFQIDGSKPPFFCVHLHGGGVVEYRELAKLLGPDQPFFGLRPYGLYEGEEFDITIEDMASRYVRAVRTIQPSGPYRLGGHCFSGSVAFEMARQLEDVGEKTALLAIIDGTALLRGELKPNLWEEPGLALHWVRNLPYWGRDFIALGPREVGRRSLRKVKVTTRRSLRRLGLDLPVTAEESTPMDLSGLMPARIELYKVQSRAYRNYAPGIYGGSATLFRVRGQPLLSLANGLLNWDKFCKGGVEVRWIPGGHYKILERPHVESLAEQLQEALQAVEKETRIRQHSHPGNSEKALPDEVKPRISRL